MMAGSTTLGTYDTFNYSSAQAEKDPSQWLVEWAKAKSTIISRAKTQSAAAFLGISLRLYAFAREIFIYQLVSPPLYPTGELLNKSLIEPGSVANVYQLTEAGCEMYNRLVGEKRGSG